MQCFYLSVVVSRLSVHPLLTDMVPRCRLLAAHGLRSCLSARTHPLTATGAPMVWYGMVEDLHRPLPYHTIPALNCPMRRHMGTSSTIKGRSSPAHYLNTVSSPAVSPGGRKAALHGTNVPNSDFRDEDQRPHIPGCTFHPLQSTSIMLLFSVVQQCY